MCAWNVIDPDRLARIALFRTCSPEDLRAVAQLMTLQVWKRNQRVVQEGTPGDAIHFIVEGTARVSRNIPGVGEEALAILSEGSFFGEMSIFGDQLRSADVYADSRLTTFMLYVDELRALLDTRPKLAATFYWSFSQTLAERVREANAKVTFLAAANAF